MNKAREENTILTDLGAKIEEISQRFSGTLGIALKTLDDGTSFFYNEHVTFPAASTLKIFVLLELFNQVKAGERQLDEFIDVPTARLGEVWSRTSSGIVKDVESVRRISLKDAAMIIAWIRSKIWYTVWA
jgi:beta-lactamase class A